MKIPKFKNPTQTTSLLKFDPGTQDWVPQIVGDLRIEKDAPGDGYVYWGFAPMGADVGDPVWKLLRIDKTISGKASFAWADGDYEWDNIWSDHLTKIYS